MMNAEVEVQLEDGRTFKYSITPEGTIYEVKKTGWRKVTSPWVCQAILQRLAIETNSFDA